ncbi:response regulator [Cytobacillus massiliigabonensis]|uniref:response regulator n=1 Tax=Cytobacillus massiliigabonensis TaxID=1871011 RepID=UPI000C856A42|nr:response regulator [Cytobacillus massiliigabonensis]
MSFKKKQFLALGLTVFCMVLLMFVILFMVNLMRTNMIEIVQDRYYKVKQATEIRQLFDQADRQLLRIVVDKEITDTTIISESLKANDAGIQSRLIDLQHSVNTKEGRMHVNQIELAYQSYYEMEQQFLADLKNGEAEKLKALYDKERANRDGLLINLDDFKDYQESLMEESLKNATNTYNTLVIVLISAVAVALILIILVTLWLIRSTSRNIHSITKGIKKIDFANLTRIPRLDVKAKDEIGEIASAFNSMASSLETYSAKEMQYTLEITEQNWITTHSSSIVHLYSHHVTIKGFAEELINNLANVLEAKLGVFYLKEEGKKPVFRNIASYADMEQKAGRDYFFEGEGLVGQCANDRKVFFLNDVPEDYQVISTGLGTIKPKSILMAPILLKDEVLAVIELASLQAFTSTQVKLLEEVLGTLGIAITNILGRMEIACLLQESQAKTEELQMQSEELQTQSEELQSQSEEMQTQAEELRMINEQLEERTKDAELKSEELQAAKESLEEKARELLQSSKYKSEFLANMSHELRTPLNSILLLSEMMTDDPDHGLSEEQVEFSKVIHSSGQDLLNLINDILDLSKVEVGKLDIHFEEVNVNEFADRLNRHFMPFAKQKNLAFTVNVSETAPHSIFTDEQRLQQIIKNLLSNAFKFTEEGSVSVSVEKAISQEFQEISFGNEADMWLKVVVSDTGIGIPEEKHEEIFEAFQQVDGATMRKYGGTGLGLSITKEFAQLLGGVCKVQSSEGAGSSFTLLIPSLPEGLLEIEENRVKVEAASAIADVVLTEELVEHEPAESIEPFDENSTVLKGRTVLVVDDDLRNIFAVKNALEKEGMNVITAENGMECLRIIEETNKMDIVLMDIMMPVMDGYETMQRIRGMEEHQDVPIIALTAKAMKSDRRKCIESGASDYISKPLNLEQLLSVMRVWLS